jgi:hypothetical protein
MSLFQEVIDSLDVLAKSVDNLKKMSDAIKSGVDYVKNNHPEAKSDLIAMSQEMTNTLDSLAVASSTITRFGFTVEGSELDKQPGKFMDYYHDKVADENKLRNQINTLRGHCHTIREHADSLEERAKKGGFNSLFNFLNIRSTQKESELADSLQNIYEEEIQLCVTVENMSLAVRKAMEDIYNTLGGASMSPKSVPLAADLLSEYQNIFREFQSNCVAVGGDLKLAIHELTD